MPDWELIATCLNYVVDHITQLMLRSCLRGDWVGQELADIRVALDPISKRELAIARKLIMRKLKNLGVRQTSAKRSLDDTKHLRQS
jgi:hypothetical protein